MFFIIKLMKREGILFSLLNFLRSGAFSHRRRTKNIFREVPFAIIFIELSAIFSRVISMIRSIFHSATFLPFLSSIVIMIALLLMLLLLAPFCFLTQTIIVMFISLKFILLSCGIFYLLISIFL